LRVKTKPAEPLQKLGRALLLAATGSMAAALLLAFGPIGPTQIHAQATASPSATAAPAAATAPLVGADGKALTFDVVSIREDQFLPNPQNRPAFGPTPDGYHLKNLNVLVAVLAAYVPSQGDDTGFFNPNQIIGIPDWLPQIRYDIDARVSEADLPKWQTPALQPAMLRAMLQAMLADRFKLAVHREFSEKPIYSLTVAKNGPKFEPASSVALSEIQQKHPGANAIFGGAAVAPGASPGQIMLFGATMQALCALLSNMAGRPIFDNTGLTGKYDISFQIELPALPQEGGGMAGPPSTGTSIFTMLPEQLGLKVEPGKGAVETLVIDHIERPSAN
jgi:bla regulator protein blaR1